MLFRRVGLGCWACLGLFGVASSLHAQLFRVAPREFGQIIEAALAGVSCRTSRGRCRRSWNHTEARRGRRHRHDRGRRSMSSPVQRSSCDATS